MPNQLDYILENNLPIKTYLDFTTLGNSTISGNTFTQLNSSGNTAYDFLSVGVANHPQRGVEGVTFSGIQKLTPRVSDLLTGQSSYSLLVVSKSSANSLLQIGKNNPNLPKLLKIDYTTTNFSQYYSRLNVTDRPLSLGDLESTQVCLLSHNIVTGVTNTSINLSEFQKNTKLDTGNLLSNFPSSFVLGEGFGGELLQFLLFAPAIENVHLLELGRRVSGYLPQAQLKFDKFVLTTEDKLVVASSLLGAARIMYNLPIKIKNPDYSSNLGFSSTLIVLASFIWDNLSESNWDSISEALWDNMG